MKRFLALFLVVVLAFSCVLISCKKDEPVEDDGEDEGEGFIGIVTTGGATTTLDPSSSATTNTDYTWTEDAEGTTVYIRAAALWLRSDANEGDAYRVDSVEFGKSFKRVKYNDTWTLVQEDQDQYYVKTAYITTDPGSVVFSDDKEKTTVYVTEDKLFLRTSTLYKVAGAKYDKNIGATVSKGQELTRVATSQNGMWIKVEYKYVDENEAEKVLTLYCNTDYTSPTAPGESDNEEPAATVAPVVPEG